MSEMPAGYDDWKTTDPREYACEVCGVDCRYLPRSWFCENGNCPHGRQGKDPDVAYDERRDEQMERDR